MYFGNQETGPVDREELLVLEAAFPGWEARFRECDQEDVLGDLAINGADPFYVEKLLLKLLRAKFADGGSPDSPMEAAPGGPSPQLSAPVQSDEPSVRAEVAPVVAASPVPACDQEAYLLTLMHEYLIRTYKGSADIWARVASLVTAARQAIQRDSSTIDSEGIKQKILQFRRSCASEMFAIDDEVDIQISSSEGQSGINSDAVVDYFVTRCFNRHQQARYPKAG